MPVTEMLEQAQSTLSRSATMSPVPAHPRLITGEEFARMNNDEPCELIEGRIVAMGQTNGIHGWLTTRISRFLDTFVDGKNLGSVLSGGVGVYIRRNPDSVRGVDIAFYSKERLPVIPTEGFLTAAPNVAVEIISPGNTFDDIMVKVEEYFAGGVERVWLVQPMLKVVWVCKSPAEWTRLNVSDTLRDEGALTGFELPVATLFDAISN